MNNDSKIIIWKNTNGENKIDNFTCYINNFSLSDTLTLKDYVNSKDNNFIKNYENVLQNNKCEIIKTNEKKIIINRISDNFICEIHLKHDDNSKILSCISHKIRNPITNIIHSLSFLDSIIMDRKNRKILNSIKTSTNEIIGIVNDVTDISNYNVEEITLENRKYYLEEIIFECKNIINDDIYTKKINFKYNNYFSFKNLITDKKKLKQILINFFDNSIENTTDGGIILEIKHFTKEEYENTKCPFLFIETKKPISNLLFKVKDTGAGLSHNNLNFAYNILNISQETQYEYFEGFGLMINKFLCNVMGGNIWFKTEKDIGTIFYFNILTECF